MSTITIKSANGVTMAKCFYASHDEACQAIANGVLNVWLRLGASLILSPEGAETSDINEVWYEFPSLTNPAKTVIGFCIAGIRDVLRGLEIVNPTREQIEDALLIMMELDDDVRVYCNALPQGGFDDFIDGIISSIG